MKRGVCTWMSKTWNQIDDALAVLAAGCLLAALLVGL